MPRPLLFVIALDTAGIIGVLLAGFAHQKGDTMLMATGIAVAALSAVAGAAALVAWSRSRRPPVEDDARGPVVQEL